MKLIGSHVVNDELKLFSPSRVERLLLHGTRFDQLRRNRTAIRRLNRNFSCKCCYQDKYLQSYRSITLLTTLIWGIWLQAVFIYHINDISRLYFERKRTKYFSNCVINDKIYVSNWNCMSTKFVTLLCHGCKNNLALLLIADLPSKWSTEPVHDAISFYLLKRCTKVL